MVVADGVGQCGLIAGFLSNGLVGNCLKSGSQDIEEMINHSCKETEREWIRTLQEAEKQRMEQQFEKGHFSKQIWEKRKEQEEWLETGSLLAGTEEVGSTLLVATIDKDHLKFSNTGDSRLIVIRDKKIICSSTEQQHYHNAPFTVSIEEGVFHRDTPACGSVTLQSGDIVVMATDGIFDNLFDENIMSITSGYAGQSAQEIAKNIVNEARKISISKDPKVVCPYGKQINDKLDKEKDDNPDEDAFCYGPTRYKGAKKDDISTLVVIVK